ncbi:MAG: TonB-dependent receptor plug domain-containing protein [Lewinellaceae bacterium]|nr:TonB-dependent receptor plug domain-containing protein [Lewinellaceae bacterium]
MKQYIILTILLLAGFQSWSQQLNGRVFDADTRAPLARATVLASGRGGTSTDKDGVFSITCTKGMELTVSYIGYETYRVTVEDCSGELQFGLKPAASTLNEVEITATSNPDKALLQQPVSIVKLGRPELQRSTGLYLDDAINTNVPGVFMQRRTISAGQSFNIRGYGNGLRGTNGINSNFDGQGSKVYLNGIPITDAEGITVLDDIDYSSAENVEVSKGPSGTLYGMAIAGVVNLQTRKAEKNKTSVSQEALLGSYGLLRTTTQLSIGKENTSLLVNYGRQEFDGYMPHTASHKDFVSVMGDFALNDKQNLTAFAGFSDSYDERNGEMTIEQYEAFDYSGNSRYIANNAHSAVTTFRAGVGHTYAFGSHLSNTTSVFGSAQSLNNSSAGGWTDKSPLNYGFRSTFSMHFPLGSGLSLSGLAGAEMQRLNALATGFQMVADSTNLGGYNVAGNVRSIQATTSSTASYFTQWTLEAPKGFSITAGLGYSTMALSLQDRLWASSNNHPGNTVPQEYKATYDNMLSPTLAINKKVGEAASVYAAYTVGYKAPVSSYFYIPTTGEVNTGLKPEKGTQIELGTKGSLMDNRLFYTLAAFSAQFTDKMTAVSVQNPDNTATLYSYIVNGGGLDNKGLELLVKYTAVASNDGFVRSFRPFANLTVSNFKYDDFVYQRVGKGASNQDSVLVYDYSGNEVAGVPPIVFNLGFDFETSVGLYGNAHYNYRDAMYFTSDELNQTSGYGVLNAKLGFRKNFGHFELNLYAGANNITGTQYYYMVFLNQLPDAYIPAPNEINYFGGANMKYVF